MTQMFHSGFFCMPEDPSCWIQGLTQLLQTYCYEELSAGYNRYVGVSGRKQQTKREIRRKKTVCVEVREGRCRNSSRATINPDTKRNTALRQKRRAWMQLWHNFTGLECKRSSKNVGHWLTFRKWDSIISTQNNIYQIPDRAAPRKLSLGFIWRWLENGSSQSTLILKHTCWAF